MKSKMIFIIMLIITPCFANDLFYLDAPEIVIKEKEALRGNPEAANELSLFYEFSNSAHNDDERYEKASYWILIAGENDVNGFYMRELSTDIICKSPNKLKTRGLYWLYLSAAREDRFATEDIEKNHNEYNFSFANDSDYEQFNKDNLDFYKDGALRGSPTAALYLANYLEGNRGVSKLMSEPIEMISDKSSYIYWLRIGAQNGSKECMRKYASILRNSTYKNDNIRAEFWEEKAGK